jgi:peptidoglycan/xylan/chitin deacetylase (PgdA/CDA1 family)
MTPHRTPFLLPLLYPSLIWRLGKKAKELFLTFDDGPVPGPTEFVLDTLQKFSVKATFFCIGNNIFKYPDIFQRIISEGHAIGNHTYHHLNGWKVSLADYLHDVELCKAEIEKHYYSTEQKLFRPPYGRIKRSMIPALQDYKIVMWDVLSVDYSEHQSPQTCFAKTLKAIRSGSIIVFHDSLKAERNLTYTLSKLIEDCHKQGYQFKPMAL